MTVHQQFDWAARIASGFRVMLVSGGVYALAIRGVSAFGAILPIGWVPT